MVKMRRVESNVDVDPKKLKDLLSTMKFTYGTKRGAPSFSYEETIKTDKFLKFFEDQVLKEAQDGIDYTISYASKSNKPFQSLLDLYDKVENDDWRKCILDEWFDFRSPAFHNMVHWRVYLSLGMKDVSLTFDVKRPYTSVYSNGDDFVNGRPYYAGMSDSEKEGIQEFFNTQIEQDRKNLYSRIENMLERIKPKVRAMRDRYVKDLQDLLKEDKNKSMEDFDGYTVFAELSDDDHTVAEYGPYPFESKRFIEDLKSATDDIYNFKNEDYEEDDSPYVENDAYLRIVVTTPDDKEVVFFSPMEVKGEFGTDRYTNIFLDLSIKSKPLEFGWADVDEDEEVEKIEKGLEKIDIPSFLTADYTEK